MVWYTDDGGKSYNATAAPFEGGFAEAQMAENSAGVIVVILRINQAGLQASKGRRISHSTDGGVTFTKVAFEGDLRSVPCQASILRSAQNGKVYYSSPSTVSGGRQLGLVRASSDGLDWSDTAAFATTVGATGYGYSSLTNLPPFSSNGGSSNGGDAGHIGVLWEMQVVGSKIRQPTELAFSHVPLDLNKV